ncbi:MAG: two component transcriptional regulator, winged helix family, partial [Jatrophihabitantaceae bacterium]|nr:two component transcriptional regulator, winged helix family [Jatrophihabitantaceae bacterium]
DAVILDWMLPGLTGPAVCAELRRRGRWAPVIMLTARTSVEDRIEGLDAGADDYLSKPFSYSELTARLRALLRRGTVERAPVLQAGEVAIDPAAQLVTVAGQELSLSAKEYSVLELLVRNKDTVLSRGRILEHSWDFAFEPNSNVVDQYVGYLRRKIAARTDSVAIVTVRSVGYRLSERPALTTPQ